MKNKVIILDYKKQRINILSFIPGSVLKDYFNFDKKELKEVLLILKKLIKERKAMKEKNISYQDKVIKYKYNRSYKDESRRTKDDFFTKG